MDNLRLKNPGIVFIFSLFAFFAIFFAGSTPRVLNPFFLYCFNKVPSLLAISKTDFICLNFLSVLCTNFSQYFFVTLEVPVTQTYFENKTIYHEHYTSRGYLSSTGYKIIIGLGSEKIIPELIIEWNDGTTSIINDLEVNKEYGISYDKTTKTAIESSVVKNKMIEEIQPENLMS